MVRTLSGHGTRAASRHRDRLPHSPTSTFSTASLRLLMTKRTPCLTWLLWKSFTKKNWAVSPRPQSKKPSTFLDLHGLSVPEFYAFEICGICDNRLNRAQKHRTYCKKWQLCPWVHSNLQGKHLLWKDLWGYEKVSKVPNTTEYSNVVDHNMLFIEMWDFTDNGPAS